MKDSIFIRLVGDYPMTRVLNFLIIFRDFDYSMSDIARESDIAWSTLNLLWPKLKRMKIIKHTRDVGKAKMYKLNNENPLVRHLIAFSDKLVKDYSNMRTLAIHR